MDVGTFDGEVVTAVSDFSNLAFRDASSAAGTSLAVGTLPIGVAAAGDTAPLAVFDVPTVGGIRAFAVAAGSTKGNGKPFGLVVVDTASYPWTATPVAARAAE